ncbi:hypothetical protein FQ082_02840 [Psychrobacter sp. ANT_H56B]|uniref:hypothetical protein n=1 Tax=Psychrobacter sp. ANT_H56B TaxID=2597353 RepID=UPI0011F27423|nr:hypothetical protein [Psychrobacter sp. ANT_H56B]KAA0928636.1 hypothetical protein FQ082_02840 [Psychrobacter sp. ANT_H56B]
MTNRKLAGIITAVLGLCALIAFFNFGMDTPILSWPLEAYLGVAFTIGWLTNLPTFLAYLIAALLFILVAVGFYKLGSWVYGLVMRRG